MNIETLAAKYSAIPSHWRLSTLGESLAAIIGGGTPSRDNPAFWGGDVPWLTVKDMRGRRPADAQEHITQQAVKESATNIIPPDTVITATRVGLGKVVRVPFAAAINQDLKALVVGPDLDKSYLEYWLLSIATFLESIGSGTTVKGIRLETLRQLPIPLAPLHEQREIVAEIEKQFSRLDEAVANLQRVKANLKRYKESIYIAVFGDVPNCTLGDLVEEGPQNGLYLPKQMYGEGVPILRIDDYQTGWIRPIEELRRVKATQDQVSTWSLLEGDLVINRVNSMTHLGKCVLVPKALAGAVFESNMMRVRLKNVVVPRYVEHYLASKIGKKRLTDNAKWAVNQASINQKDVRATQIFLPDTATQVQTVAEVDRRLSIVREAEGEVDANLQRAQAFRQATLSKMFGVPHA